MQLNSENQSNLFDSNAIFDTLPFDFKFSIFYLDINS